MNTRVRASYEPRLVAEYVSETFPDGICMFDVPLGPIPPSAPRSPTGQYLGGVARTSRSRADAIVIDAGILYVVEGKILDVSLGAGKLPLYERLVPNTPELQDYKDLPRKMILVSANPVQWSAQEAITAGIDLVIFQPEWVKEYMEHRNNYYTAAARRERAARKARLIALGYDR